MHGMRSVSFYKPSPTVQPVSITGSACELDCPHCRGKYLKGMRAAITPEEVIEAFLQAREQGAKAVLISGGFTRGGSLPVRGLLAAIREGKRLTGLAVQVHSGITDEAGAMELGAAGIDAVLLDVIGDDVTIRKMGGGWSVGDYARTIRLLRETVPVVAPHVLIGAGGSVEGEYRAIDLIASAGVEAAAMLTLMDGGLPIEEVSAVMGYARRKIDAHLSLGCMRERGRLRPVLEKLAIDYGYDGIANPSGATVEYARSQGIASVTVSGCCVFSPERTPRSTTNRGGARRGGSRGTSV